MSHTDGRLQPRTKSIARILLRLGDTTARSSSVARYFRFAAAIRGSNRGVLLVAKSGHCNSSWKLLLRFDGYPSSRRARRPSCFSAATSLAHSLKGRAGVPPMRAPGATSSLTCAMPAICAPLPTVTWPITPECAPITTKSPSCAEPANTTLGDNHAMAPDDDVMGDLHQVVYLGAFAAIATLVPGRP
jgi:hypothetical protein